MPYPHVSRNGFPSSVGVGRAITHTRDYQHTESNYAYSVVQCSDQAGKSCGGNFDTLLYREIKISRFDLKGNYANVMIFRWYSSREEISYMSSDWNPIKFILKKLFQKTFYSKMKRFISTSTCSKFIAHYS